MPLAQNAPSLRAERRTVFDLAGLLRRCAPRNDGFDGRSVSLDDRTPLARRACARRFALAWPLILSNLTMALIQATDVVLMGWLGPHALAASALGAQPDLHLHLARHRPGRGLVADDGDRAWASAPTRCATSAASSARRAGSRLHLAGGLGWCCGTPEASSLLLGQEPALAARRRSLPARLHVEHPAVPAVPGDAQFPLGARAAAVDLHRQRIGHRPQRACSAGR